MDVCRYGEEASCSTLCLTAFPPPEPRLLQQHTSLPQNVAGLRAACFTPVQSAWNRQSDCRVRAQVKCAPGPCSSSTGPALQAMYCSSLISLALPQQPAPLGLVVGTACGMMEPIVGFITEREGDGSSLAQEGIHSCFVSIALELFLVISRELKVWEYHLGLLLKEILFLHPSVLNRLHESCV